MTVRGKMNSRMKSRTTSKHTIRKVKKSYTLSAGSVQFLEILRKRRPSRSVSAILEEILQQSRREQAKAALNRAVSDYYDSLSPNDSEEQIQWGEFALMEFPAEST
jgi:hypothetical protein